MAGEFSREDAKHTWQCATYFFERMKKEEGVLGEEIIFTVFSLWVYINLSREIHLCVLK